MRPSGAALHLLSLSFSFACRLDNVSCSPINLPLRPLALLCVPMSEEEWIRSGVVFSYNVCNLENLAAQISERGPANCDICLGVRTVRVLSVAKEVAALPADRSHWPQSAQTQAGQIELTDRRLSAKKL